MDVTRITTLTTVLQAPEIDSALQFISEIIHQLTNQKASIVDDIHSTFDELQKTLNVRKSKPLWSWKSTMASNTK